MFFGEYEYKIDEKGRVPVPPRFRREFREGIWLAPGAEPCITAYTPAEWKKVSAEITTGPINRSKFRKLNRALFATAFYINLDGQGRVALPIPLREYAGIEEEVVVTKDGCELLTTYPADHLISCGTPGSEVYV